MAVAHKVSERVYIVGGAEITDPYDCSVYLVDAGDLVLIDSGAGRSFDDLVSNIEGLGFDPGKLSTVIATHRHIDHIGALHQFQKSYGAKVVAHELDAPAIETGRNAGAEYYGLDYAPCQVDTRICAAEEKLRFGDLDFNFVHIPGHTPGSLAVYFDLNGVRVLFGQDVHGPYLAQWGGNTADAEKSLRKLLDLKADILCEGHFGVYQPAGNVERYIKRYLGEFEEEA